MLSITYTLPILLQLIFSSVHAYPQAPPQSTSFDRPPIELPLVINFQFPSSSPPFRRAIASASRLTVPSLQTGQISVGPPIGASFISYSIELAYFPDFAGSPSAPNSLTVDLLDNIRILLGASPILRVGGNTQDFAVFDPSLAVPIRGTLIPARSPDYPTVVSIGPSFFDSYSALPSHINYIHGFNLAKNSDQDIVALSNSIPFACKNIPPQQLRAWEIGNEPDLYRTSAQGPVRSLDWTEESYVKEWNAVRSLISAKLHDHCPQFQHSFPVVAPSFSGTDNSLNLAKTWSSGMSDDTSIREFTVHHYMGGATQPGVTLQDTLMNHLHTVSSMTKLIESVSSINPSLPVVLSEANSLYNQGRVGLSDTLGAALWNLDFTLYCASAGIERVHYHQGTDYRYASWQPITTTKGGQRRTKAPYYGNIAAASALGKSSQLNVQVGHIAMRDPYEAGYAIYDQGRLTRIVAINMQAYNQSGPTHSPSQRGEGRYRFGVGPLCSSGVVRRLTGPGSDAVDGIEFDGNSYAAGAASPIDGRQNNEPATIENEMLAVIVPHSSAAVIELECEYSNDWSSKMLGVIGLRPTLIV